MQSYHLKFQVATVIRFVHSTSHTFVLFAMYSDHVNLECWETIKFWAEQTENIEKEHLEKGTEGLIQD